mmetsp:Transcript_17395/g.53243  ORF Transcript_17395/g.53243 Transcript_17395/m.53243 type:complete len:216 (-) Transcript_17395:84-731(-)
MRERATKQKRPPLLPHRKSNSICASAGVLIYFPPDSFSTTPQHSMYSKFPDSRLLRCSSMKLTTLAASLSPRPSSSNSNTGMAGEPVSTMSRFPSTSVAKGRKPSRNPAPPSRSAKSFSRRCTLSSSLSPNQTPPSASHHSRSRISGTSTPKDLRSASTEPRSAPRRPSSLWRWNQDTTSMTHWSCSSALMLPTRRLPSSATVIDMVEKRVRVQP